MIWENPHSWVSRRNRIESNIYLSMSTSSKCSSRQSHSDYCSAGSYSSDEESTSTDGHHRQPKTYGLQVLPAGVCPHCHRMFEQPVSLQCGHSLCFTCCAQLVHIENCASSTLTGGQMNSHSQRRQHPRMGVSSCVMITSSSSSSTATATATPQSSTIIVYRTPKCLVCGAAASQMAPIPNLELDNFLRNIKSFRWNDTSVDTNKNGRRLDEDRFSIHECKIAVLGGRGVGKTCLARVQYSNEIMFPDLLNELDDADSYIIDIVDGMNIQKSFTSAHGIIIMYSIANRQSFYEAAEIFKLLENGREHNQPIVLVGSKKDKERRREVESFEGQKLARTIGCPFLEVSAKLNDNVHETFTELVSMIQRQQNLFKTSLDQTIS